MSKQKFARLVVAMEQATHVAEETERDMRYIAKDLGLAEGQGYREAIREAAAMSDTHLLTLMGMQGSSFSRSRRS
jgi:hypothetical protein